jgi:glutathione S-transferase
MLTVHHLENSRSQRILWLLEELGVEYDIKRYGRDKETSLAPPELQEIHPLGKAPVIDDDGQVVAESGAIVEYLVGKYDDGTLLPEAGAAAVNLVLRRADDRGRLPDEFRHRGCGGSY